MTRRFLQVLLTGAGIVLGSCAPSDPYYTARDPYVYNTRTASRNTGIAGGSVAGAIIGNNTSLGTTGGLVAGAVLGGILGDVAGQNRTRSAQGMSTSSGSMGYRYY